MLHLGGHDLIKYHHFRVKLTELNEMYFIMSARSVALSMIGIFIPIYLYNLGFPLHIIFFYYAFLKKAEL